MRRTVQIVVAAAAVALASAAGTTSAKAGLITGLLGGGCGTTAPVFSPWNDWSGYYFAPNGGFESGSNGWRLAGGASVVSGNEPFRLSGKGSHSLLLPAGSSAQISVCYGLTYPAVRFVAGGAGGSAKVHVRVVAQSLLGVLSILDGGTFTVSSGWDAAPKLSTLFSALGAPLGTKSMQLIITSESGTAQIDDHYVDPFFMKS
jgi:hypothetical protein